MSAELGWLCVLTFCAGVGSQYYMAQAVQHVPRGGRDVLKSIGVLVLYVIIAWLTLPL